MIPGRSARQPLAAASDRGGRPTALPRLRPPLHHPQKIRHFPGNRFCFRTPRPEFHFFFFSPTAHFHFFLRLPSSANKAASTRTPRRHPSPPHSFLVSGALSQVSRARHGDTLSEPASCEPSSSAPFIPRGCGQPASCFVYFFCPLHVDYMLSAFIP